MNRCRDWQMDIWTDICMHRQMCHITIHMSTPMSVSPYLNIPTHFQKSRKFIREPPDHTRNEPTPDIPIRGSGQQKMKFSNCLCSISTRQLELLLWKAGLTAQHLQDCPIFLLELSYVHKSKQNRIRCCNLMLDSLPQGGTWDSTFS